MSTELAFLDNIGQSRESFTDAEFTGVAKAIVKVANLYADLIRKNFNQSDAVSSGRGVDSIQPLEIEYNGKVFSIKIQAKDYLQFVSAGVNGVVQDRGSIYSFRNYGTPDSMVQNVKDWLIREGKMGKAKKIGKEKIVPVSQKERRRMNLSRQKIEDITARSAAYMIKRQGIKGNFAIERATDDMTRIISSQLSAALRADIIRNIV